MNPRRLASRLLRPPMGPPALGRPGVIPYPSPPACPRGWDTGPPDFVGVGAQRCGTTWWFELVSAHPGVSRAPGSVKEVHFFDPHFPDPVGAAPADYHRHFPREPGHLVGEWTPRYMYDFWTPRLLHQLAPSARLLVLLRDPVERYPSGLQHETGWRFTPEGLLLASDCFGRGLYHQQMQRLLRHFPRDQVLVLQYEQCVRSPATELARTYSFLELDDFTFPSEKLSRRVNGSTAARKELTPALRESLAASYQDDTVQLLTAFPAMDGDLWPSMKQAR